jgi:molecular chaperone DnaK (HSP70)
MATERIGIDFGTSTVLVASRSGGVGPVRILPIGRTTAWMPSLVGLDASGVVVGEDAEGLPESAVLRSVKTALYAGASTVPLSDPNGSTVHVGVHDAITAIFRSVIERSRAAGLSLEDHPIRLSCPANWTAKPRKAIVDLARAAGLDASVNRMLDEPISAGVAWVMGRYFRGDEIPDGKVVVFDYGGGTLDVAVLEVKPASPPEITVLAAAAKHEAGDRLDEIIAGELLEEHRHHAAGDHPELGEREVERLFRLAARRLKEELSVVPEAATSVAFGAGEPVTLAYGRPQLELAFGPMLERAMRVVWSTLRATELRRRNSASPDVIRGMETDILAKDVSYVLLAGGMSRVPLVKTDMERAFPNAVVAHDHSVAAPEESVVAGLVHDEAVSELNLDRPAFDIRVRLVDRRSGAELADQMVFPAFTPLYQSAQVVRGESSLGHGTTVKNPFPRTISAQLSCFGIDGAKLPLYVDGAEVASLDVDLDPHRSIPFKLYVDGRVAFGPRVLRVDRWPVIRGGSGGAIAFVSPPSTYTDHRQPGWWGERD